MAATGCLYLTTWTVLMILDIHAISTVHDSCEPCHCYNKRSADGLPGVLVADCSNLDLNDVPELPENVEEVDYSSNRFTSISPKMIEKYPMLKSLKVRNNLMSTICLTRITSTSLRQLDLRGNNISMNSRYQCPDLLNILHTLLIEVVTLDIDSFMPFQALMNVHMTSHCDIPEGLFQPLSTIHSIHLRVPTMTSLPDELFSSPAMAIYLKSLVIDGPNLVKVDKKLFKDITRLKHIHLKLRSETLPKDVFYQDMAGGHKDFRFFLNSVIIEGVARLPAEIFNYLPSLTQLTVTGSSYITDDMLTNNLRLKKLTLSNNKLDSVPTQLISSLAELKHLNLSGNVIHSVMTNDLSGIAKLENLDLSSNHIDYISEDAFIAFAGSLKHLNLSRNPLCLTSRTILESLTSLLTLRCNMSCRGSLSSITHLSLQRLIEFHLGQTNIKSIPSGIFSMLPNLKTVSSDSRRITSIQHDQYQTLVDSTKSVSTKLYSSYSNLTFTRENNKHFILTDEASSFCNCQELLVVPLGSDNLGNNVLCAFRREVPFLTTDPGCSYVDGTTSTSPTTITKTQASKTTPTASAISMTTPISSSRIYFQATTKILPDPLPPLVGPPPSQETADLPSVMRPTPERKTPEQPSKTPRMTPPILVIPTISPRNPVVPMPTNHSNPSSGVKVLYYVIPICAIGLLILLLFGILHALRKKKRQRGDIMRRQNQEENLYSDSPYLLLSPYPNQFVYSQSPTSYPRTPPVKYSRRELDFDA